MNSRGGRGRGISNEPAWMTKGGGDHDADHQPLDKRDHPNPKPRDRDYSDSREFGGRSSRSYGDRGNGNGSGGGNHRYDPRNDRRRDYRGDGPPRDHRGDRRGGGGRPREPRRRRKGIFFKSYGEERAWVEDRGAKRKARKSLFDVEPTEEQKTLDELQKASLASHGPNPNVFLRPEKNRAPENGIPTASLQPQQTRHARRLYIGQVSPDLSEEDVHNFFRECVSTAMGNSDVTLMDDPILSVYINRERHFAFIEFKTIDVCSACLALNGINLRNRGKVVIKRPNDYNAAIAPPPNDDFLKSFDVSKLGIVCPVVTDSSNKIFIGGLPYHLNDDQVMELLGAFGKIKAFHLVKADASAVTSKGYCFVEYVEKSARDVAIIGLNGMDMGGGKKLTAKMASARVNGEGAEVGTAAIGGNTGGAMKTSITGSGSVGGVSIPPAIMKYVDSIDVEALVDIAMGKSTMSAMLGSGNGVSVQAPQATGILDIANAALQAAYGAPSLQPVNGTSGKTRILVLHNMVSEEDFASEEDYSGLKDEVKEEAEKFGSLISMKIPHPRDDFAPTAVKKIFLEYATAEDAMRAECELAGRQFGSSTVVATFFSETEYTNGKLA